MQWVPSLVKKEIAMSLLSALSHWWQVFLNWWNTHSLRRKLKIVAFLGSLAGAVVGFYQLAHIVSQFWEPQPYLQVSSTPMKVLDDEIKKEVVDEIKGAHYDAMTQLYILNPTTSQLRSFYATVPREGHYALLDIENKLVSQGRFKRRLDLLYFAPASSYLLVIWHNGVLKPEDNVTVSSELTGRLTLPYKPQSELMATLYEFGFWLFVSAFALFFPLKAWLKRRRLQQAPAQAGQRPQRRRAKT
jgi:hypothetical protein